MRMIVMGISDSTIRSVLTNGYVGRKCDPIVKYSMRHSFSSGSIVDLPTLMTSEVLAAIPAGARVVDIK